MFSPFFKFLIKSVVEPLKRE